ncbi:MAG: 6-bladed beta-propeller [Rhodothermus sp.]|nr:6-bladed beta-propeller [Rhodothermus sp.]
MRGFLGISMAVMVVAGCKRGGTTGEVQHPWLAQVHQFPGPEDTLYVEATLDRTIPSDEWHLIGRIAAGLIGERHIYIADDEYKGVHVYDHQGKWLKTVGRGGEGPAEFLRPSQLGWIGRDTLAVLDGGRGLLKLFRVQDTTFVYLEDLQLFAGVEDFCVLQHRLYVRGGDGQLAHYVHVYDLKGRRLQSFGRIPGGYEDELVRVYVAGGLIACLERELLIITASRILPVITAYRPDGTLLWEYRLPDFVPVRIHLPEPGAVEMDTHKRYDVVMALEPFMQGVLWQIGHRNNMRFVGFTTYYVDANGNVYVVNEESFHSNAILNIRSSSFIEGNNFPEPKVFSGIFSVQNEDI